MLKVPHRSGRVGRGNERYSGVQEMLHKPRRRHLSANWGGYTGVQVGAQRCEECVTRVREDVCGCTSDR